MPTQMLNGCPGAWRVPQVFSLTLDLLPRNRLWKMFEISAVEGRGIWAPPLWLDTVSSMTADQRRALLEQSHQIAMDDSGGGGRT